MKTAHPAEEVLADFLENRLSGEDRKGVERHLASCGHCLSNVISAYKTVKSLKKDPGNGRKFNLYIVLAAITFILSFTVPRYFIQFLVATLILGAKWVVDAKSTRMLITIHEAWKNNGDRGASEVLKRFDTKIRNR